METNKPLLWDIEKTVSKGDYTYAVVKQHPNATKYGYVLEHRVVMENHLKRLLKPNEIVHHIDGNKKNNKLSNLEVHDFSEHARSHAISRTNGRQMVVLICPSCNDYFFRERRQTHLVRPSSYTCCSTKCRGKFSSKIQYQGNTKEVEDAISTNVLYEYRSYLKDNTKVTHIH